MAVAELAIPRETAEVGPLVREAAADRTFTEGEAYALVADGVQRETAAKVAEIDALKSEIAALTAANAAVEADRDLAIAGKEKAELDLVTYQTDQARDAEIAGLKVTRTAKVREVAAHLADDFYTAERAERWASMGQADFDAYTAELAFASAGKTGAAATATGAPAETAMAGAAVVKPTGNDFFKLSKGGI